MCEALQKESPENTDWRGLECPDQRREREREAGGEGQGGGGEGEGEEEEQEEGESPVCRQMVISPHASQSPAAPAWLRVNLQTEDKEDCSSCQTPAVLHGSTKPLHFRVLLKTLINA